MCYHQYHQGGADVKSKMIKNFVCVIWHLSLSKTIVLPLWPGQNGASKVDRQGITESRCTNANAAVCYHHSDHYENNCSLIGKPSLKNIENHMKFI